MHQSSTFSIQRVKTFSKRAGIKVTLFFVFWFFRVFCANGFILINHCLEIIGSTIAPLRSEWPIGWMIFSILNKSPFSLISATRSFRHSNLSSPSYFPASSFIVASLFMQTTFSKPCFSPNVKSFGSWAGVHFIAPVPKFISTYSSPIIGSCFPFAGLIAFLPINFWYRLSRGLTIKAVSPNIVSGRVVAITKISSLSTTLYLK